MLRQIKSTLKSGQTQTLTITKKTQMFGGGYTGPENTYLILTSRDPLGSYPIIENDVYHLNEGVQIVVESLQNANVDPNWRYIAAFKCKASNGMTFYLFENDTKRFTSF